MLKAELKATVVGRFVGGALFAPKANRDDPERSRYSACIVLDRDEAQEIRRIVAAAVQDWWGNKKPAGLQDWGLRQGDDPDYAASYGKDFINPKALNAPPVLVCRGGIYQTTTQEEDLVYPGCYVAASVSAYAYEGDRARNIKPGVTLQLRSVLFVRDGERLDDAVNPEVEFAGVAVTDVEIGTATSGAVAQAAKVDTADGAEALDDFWPQPKDPAQVPADEAPF